MNRERTDEVRDDRWENCWESWWEDGWETCWGNWWKTDRIDAIGWAAIFIWAAIVLLAGSAGYADRYAWWDGWSLFLAGAGAIILIEVGARMVLTEVRRPIAMAAIFGVFLFGLGLDGLLKGDWFWPVLLGAVGATILVRAITRRA
jgi:hypothetical protein